MGLKAKIEAIIYAAEEPITIEQISVLVKDMVLAELAAEQPAQPAVEPEPPATQQAIVEEAEAQPAESEPAPVEAAPQATTSDAVESSPEAMLASDESTSTTEATTADTTPTEVQEQEASPSEPVAAEPAPLDSASVAAPEPTRKKKRSKDKDSEPKKEPSEDAKVRAKIREILELLTIEYSSEERGMEIRQVAGGYRMATKPEHHDVVRAFAKSLKPPVRLSLAALETLAVIAYKQPITVPEISEIRGVESGGVIGTLLDRKLITTAGRKQVIGRPILYKTSKEFLLRFGLNDLAELPSMEEFEKLAADGQGELFIPEQSPETPAPNAPETQATEAGQQTEDARPEPTEAAPEAAEPSESAQAEATEAQVVDEPVAEGLADTEPEPQAEAASEPSAPESPSGDAVAEIQPEVEPEQADVARQE